MVKISICGMCKHVLNGRNDNACRAFPNGKTPDKCFPYAGEECGNGFQFEPNEESKGLWDKQMMKNFSRPTEEDLRGEVSVGEG